MTITSVPVAASSGGARRSGTRSGGIAASASARAMPGRSPAARGVVAGRESVRERGLRAGRPSATMPGRRRPAPGDRCRLTRSSSASGRSGIASAVRSIRMGACPASRSGAGAAPGPPRGSSASRLAVRRMSREWSSPTGRGAMPPRGPESCPAWSIGRAGVPATGPGCRASRRAAGNTGCGGSSHPATRGASSPPMAGSGSAAIA